MKSTCFLCLFLCLTATFLLSQSSPPLLNQTTRVAASQSGPAVAQQAITPQSPATPTAGQETKQGDEGNLATIIQSRSTNTRGYKVVVHNDGSATAEIGGAGSPFRVVPSRSQQFPPGTVDTKTLRRLLTEIGDVSRIPTGGCVKSVSFGTSTQIAYMGKTSGDLQCIRRQASGGDQALLQASQELSRFAQTTLRQLKINDRPRFEPVEPRNPQRP